LRVAEVRKIDSSAIKVVRPELEIFYGVLTDKQKARFNQLSHAGNYCGEICGSVTASLLFCCSDAPRVMTLV